MPVLDLNLLPNAFELVAGEAAKYRDLLLPLAKSVLGYAVLFSGTWLLVKESLTNSPRNALAALMLLLMQAAIALAVIMNWALFADLAYAFQAELARTLGGATTAMTAVLEPLSKGMADIANAAFTLGLIPPSSSGLGIMGRIYDFLVNFATSIMALPVKILFGFISVMLMGLIAAVLGGAIMFAEISLAIGLAAAPLMIALNFFPYFNFTIDGLVRFLLGTVVLKFVAMLTAVILGSVLGTTLQGVNTLASGGGTQIVALIFVLFVVGAFLYVAIKVDDIARALMMGGVVGGPGAKVISTGSVQAGQGAAGAAVKGSAEAAKGAASGAMSGMRSGAAGGGMMGGVYGGSKGASIGAALGGAAGALKGAVGGAAKGGVSGAASGALRGMEYTASKRNVK